MDTMSLVECDEVVSPGCQERMKCYYCGAHHRRMLVYDLPISFQGPTSVGDKPLRIFVCGQPHAVRAESEGYTVNRVLSR